MPELVPLKRLVVLRRVIELFVPTIFFSFVLTLTNVAGVVIQRDDVTLTAILFIVLITIYNLSNLKKCYIDMCDRYLYLFLNLLSQIIFATVNFICYFYLPKGLYTWLFSITKILIYYIDIETVYSIAFYHLIGIVTIWVATSGMDWIFYEDEF